MSSAATTTMQTGEIKMRFGRCPYCRAMVYQNPKAVIFYCSKCRTPIRGKNPEPADEAEYALSRLEILSADTASVFSDELDAASCTQAWVVSASLSSSVSCFGVNAESEETAPSSSSAYRGYGSARTGSGELDELRPSSSSDSSIQRYNTSVSGSSEGYYTPGRECEQQQQQQPPPASSSEPSAVAPSSLNLMALADPEVHREMLQALDNLRRLIIAIELHPRPAGGGEGGGGSGGGRARALTRRDSRFFRRLESQLAQALPADAEELAPCQKASAGSPESSSTSGRRDRPAVARQHHCRTILGGAPFVVCGGCSELLQTPTKVPMQPSRGREFTTRLRCGGCEEVLELALPAAGVAQHHAQQRSRTCSAGRAYGSRSWHGTGEVERA